MNADLFLRVLDILMWWWLGFSIARMFSMRHRMRAMTSLIEKQEEIIRALHSQVEWSPALPSYLQKASLPPSSEPN